MRTSTFLTLLAATTTPTVATHIIFVVADDLGFNDGMAPSQSLLRTVCHRCTDSALRGVRTLRARTGPGARVCVV